MASLLPLKDDNISKGMINNGTYPILASARNDESTSDRQEAYSVEEFEQAKKNTTEAPVWSILPSYDMHRTIDRETLNASTSEGFDEPPNYEDSSTGSGQNLILTANTSASSASFTEIERSGQQQEIRRAAPHAPRTIIADRGSSHWESTIIGHAHKLKNLTATNTKISDAVHIEIQFTKEVGEIGKRPVILDPKYSEFKQGDLLNGQILIRNVSSSPIPFDMFYVTFQGSIKFYDPKSHLRKDPVQVKTFLEMLDLSASWNYVHINRLITERSSEHVCPDTVDPLDNSRIYIQGRKLLPGVLYKRFFTFKIPLKLLDTECSKHNLLQHFTIPPTLSTPRENGSAWTDLDKTIKDFSFSNTCIGYGVQAVFIGRKSKHKFDPAQVKGSDTLLLDAKGDEFLILKDCFKALRIMPTPSEGQEMKVFNKQMSRLGYKSLIDQIESAISEGTNMLKELNNDEMSALNLEATHTSESLSLGNSVSHSSEETKARQLYQPGCTYTCKGVELSKDETPQYELLLPYNKSSYFQKFEGKVSLRTPKTEYILKYLSPSHILKEPESHNDILNSWNIKIPLNLRFYCSSMSDKKEKIDKKLPKINGIRAEFIVHDIKSQDMPIPIELTEEIFFQNKQNAFLRDMYYDQDFFRIIVRDKFRRYLTQIYNLLKTLGPDRLLIEKKMVDDMKAICDLDEKVMKFNIPGIKIEDLDHHTTYVNIKDWKKDNYWKSLVQEEAKSVYELNLNLGLDLKTCKTYGGDQNFANYCFVPNFQLCHLGRFYYIRITIEFSNSNFVHFKLPVTIER